MITKLPEFVACNLKCVFLVLQRLVKCSINDRPTEIYGDLMFRWDRKLRVAHLENFVKNLLILTDKRRRMNEENISVW